MIANAISRATRGIRPGAVSEGRGWWASGWRPAANRPDRPRTLELLIAWHQSSGSLRAGDLCRENMALAIHVHSAFGSFTNALFAARLIPQPKQRRGIAAWDAATVIAGLRARQARGDARRKIWEQQPALPCAAWHFLGGLDSAVAGANE